MLRTGTQHSKNSQARLLKHMLELWAAESGRSLAELADSQGELAGIREELAGRGLGRWEPRQELGMRRTVLTKHDKV